MLVRVMNAYVSDSRLLRQFSLKGPKICMKISLFGGNFSNLARFGYGIMMVLGYGPKLFPFNLIDGIKVLIFI